MSEGILNLEKAIKEVIEKEALSLQEEIVKAAVAEFEKQLRRAIGNIAIDVSNYFSVQQMAHELVINVKLEARK